MNLLSAILASVLGIAILALIVLSVYYAIKPFPYTVLEPSYGSLNRESKDTNAAQLGTTDQVTNSFTKTGEGTIAIFLYLNPLQRTATLQDGAGAVLGSDPSSVCLFQLMDIYGAPSLALITHPAGNGVSELTSELRVKMQDGSVETLKFKPIPIQKWIYVTVSRRGRRYNVFYNDEQVASFRTSAYPSTDTVKWVFGDPTVSSGGNFAFPLLSDRESTIQDVKQRMAKFADTRNKPILPKASITTAFAAFKGCPDGLFCFGANTAPSDALSAWTTPFA